MNAVADKDERKTLYLTKLQQTGGSRGFCILVSPVHRPVTELHSEDFAKMWWKCVLGHKELWDHGIHHRDVGLNSLMYYKNDKSQPVGILIDYDLRPKINGRIGTPAFMAFDLLNSRGLAGQVMQLYRHDLESFFWALVLFCLQNENGKQRKKGPLDAWLKVNTDICHEKKSGFLNRMDDFTALATSLNPNLNLWCIAYEYAFKIIAQQEQRKRLRRPRARPAQLPTELSNDMLFKELEDVVLEEYASIMTYENA
ncbi:hypothetical protein BJ138DRAFT_398158 [Hygrophoropsis aurantiaca]|uniref:Uncharacterized protein n=1 Tax=Hygrophoropsis aurantiaca TaxID=72124 RepID=A0ACB8A501_9AGAM|nr:hypothetical protein BJ138DRAFT_398158 [Hygrophoropsis aurantiaca]